jgi:uncharacterized membrane protein
MIILKSIGFGFASLIVGNLASFILGTIVGLVVEPVTEKILSEPALRKFRYAWHYAWVGFSVGMINSASVYFFKMNGWILTVIFVFYLVMFMGRRSKNFVLEEICAGDESQLKKYLIRVELITFISYAIGLYGLWTVLLKCGTNMPNSSAPLFLGVLNPFAFAC